MIRHLYLSATELFLHRSIFYDIDKNIAHASYRLAGKARISKDALSVIADKDSLTHELSLTLKPWPKDEPSTPNDNVGHWRGCLSFNDFDWEIGHPAEWFVELYLPPPAFDELVNACKKASLATLSIGLKTDLWVRDYDLHTPPSGDVTWYLAPGEYGAEMAQVIADHFDWTEKALPLRRSPWDSETSGDEQENAADVSDPEERAKRFEAAQIGLGERQLAIAERVRKALYFVGAMLALVVLILAFK